MLMNSNKSPDSREGSVSQKIDLDEPQAKDAENNRQNARGYSWWKWRRSNDSVDKKSPPKEHDDRTNLRQSVEHVDEIKEIISDLGNLSMNESNTIDESQTVSGQNLSADSNNVTGKNDDSISSELADISKSSFSNEKYRKTLRLTSDQIVREYFSKLFSDFIRVNQISNAYFLLNCRT